MDVRLRKGYQMTLRNNILELIGQEYAHLRGKALLVEFANIVANKAYQEGIDSWTMFGLSNELQEVEHENLKYILSDDILKNIPPDAKVSWEYRSEAEDARIIKHYPLGEFPKESEKKEAKKLYLKLEVFYNSSN